MIDSKYEALDVFGEVVREVGGATYEKNLVTLASDLVDYHRQRIPGRVHPLSILENAWYAGGIHSPARHVYKHSHYIAEAFASWWVWTRRYINDMARSGRLDNIPSLLDLGCGCGFSAAQFRQRIPGVGEIHCTELDTPHAAIAKALGKRFDFTVHTDMDDIEGVTFDTVFASLYFEKFRWPIDEVKRVIRQHNPERILHASDFSREAIGSFRMFYLEDVEVYGYQFARGFNFAIKEMGYRKIDTGWWNGRPVCFIRSPSDNQE